jgi:hypothetical protein
MTSRPVRAILPSLVALPLLLAGCSSADPAPAVAAGSPAADPSASASASASADADADAERKTTFCRDVPGLLTDISTDLQGVYSAPETAPQLMAQAVDRISAVEPPAEAAPQWQRLVTAWTDMRDLLGRADLTDRAANADLAPELQRLQTELVDSGTAIDDYGKANC